MSGDFGISVTFLFIVLILLFILSGFTVDMWQSHQANIRTGYNALSYNEWIHKKTTVFFVLQAEIRFFFSPFISGWNALLMGGRLWMNLPTLSSQPPFIRNTFVSRYKYWRQIWKDMGNVAERRMKGCSVSFNRLIVCVFWLKCKDEWETGITDLVGEILSENSVRIIILVIH